MSEHQHQFEFEIVVVGGGPAGLAAASVAAENGRSTALLDEAPWLGGQIWRGQPAHGIAPSRKESATSQARHWLDRLQASGAQIFDRTSVIAAPESGTLLAEHGQAPRQFRYQKLILATGARELFLPFPGWTLPGIVGPGGLQGLVKSGWPVNGLRVLIAGSGPLLLAVADGLQKHGAQVVAIFEQAPWAAVRRFGMSLWRHPGKLWQAAQLKFRLTGTPYHCGAWPVRAEGNNHVRCVTLTDGRSTWTHGCDFFACGFGLVPNVELPLALGSKLNNGFVQVDQWQATTSTHDQVYCAGEPTGIAGADCALVEGQIAGFAASGCLKKAETLFREREVWHQFRAALADAFILRPELRSLATEDTLVCRCEDVSLGRLRQFKSWREAKLQSRCGMGSCQGRVCGAASQVILGWGMESVRPPVLPARVGSLISKQEPAPAIEPDIPHGEQAHPAESQSREHVGA